MAQADSRPAPEYDVFLSHAGEDSAWCERLAQRLTAAGVRVWFDRWELRAGDHLGARLDDGLEHSRRMVAVWSPHYFRQDKLWTVAESYTRHHGDPLVRDRPLIPVLLADCDIKPMFRNLLYVDFRNPAEFERRFGELLEALGLTEGEPAPGLEGPGRRTPARDVLSPNTWPRPKGADNPGSLLNARYEVVPFHEASRAKELGVLEGWCAGQESTSLRLFYGPGGAGKTRLAIEWVKRVLSRGWHAGFLPEGVPEQDVALVVSGPGPTLVVVDYAEARPELLGVLRRVAARRDRAFGPLRVVLLAREVADWWHSLAKQDAAVADLLGQYEPVRLEPVPLAGPLRQEVFERAWTTLAAIREKTGPLPRPDLADPRFGRMLYLHMAALAAVEGLPLAAATLLEEIVAHEGHFWARPYEDHLAGLLARTEFLAGAARVVAAATLLGGLSSIEAAEALQERVEGPAQKDFCRFLPWLYPGRGKPGAQDYYLSGLEPDLLGETLVAGVLSARTTRGDFLDRVFESAGPGALRNGFFVLGRISLRRPQEAAGWIAQVLDRDVARRALPAFEAALSLGKETAHAPLGTVLARSLRREGTADVAAVLEPLLPDLTVSLREVALWATETLLARLPKESTEEDMLRQRARLLNNLGNRLSDLGRREEALQAAQEAVDIRRTLAAGRPDAFLPDLAGSLNNLGLMLSHRRVGIAHGMGSVAFR